MGKQSVKAGLLRTPKGMHDILPADQLWWEKMRKTLREVADFYNFLRIDTPVVEYADLFRRSVGEDTDVVEKQIFSIHGKGEGLVLRPEATTSIARAYIMHGLGHTGQPTKLYFEGPLFRHEQPQAGRYREFHQADFEIISGEDDPLYDTQVILACMRFFEGVRLKGVTAVLNSIGCRTCRPPYRRELIDYYRDKTKALCTDCARRMKTNPLRILDCKAEQCGELKRDAPIIIDHLCRHCHDHYKLTLEYLEEVKIPYALDHYLVRGFDYYTRTVFEFSAEGAPAALGGGGRYNYLIELLGGKSTPAVGAAIGLERVLEALRAKETPLGVKTKAKIFLVAIGMPAKKKSLSLIEQLRVSDIEVAEALGKESLKAQLRLADKFGASLALIFGQREAFEETIIIRDLKTGAQETVPLKKLVENLKRRPRS